MPDTDVLYERLEELLDPEELIYVYGPVRLSWIIDTWDLSLDPDLPSYLHDLVEHAQFDDLVEAIEWVESGLIPVADAALGLRGRGGLLEEYGGGLQAPPSPAS